MTVATDRALRVDSPPQLPGATGTIKIMNDTITRPAAPGGVLEHQSVLLNEATFGKSEMPSGTTAAPVVDRASEGVSIADRKNTEHVPVEPDLWAAPGAAVLTTDEARLYLYDKHDVFLKERYIQKLVTEQKRIVGRRVPKDGGGTELQLLQASLDEYAHSNPQKKNAHEVVLDPADRIFNELRSIASHKPYDVKVEGDIIDTPPPALETPPLARTPAEPTPIVIEPEKTSPAFETPSLSTAAPGDAVPREFYNAAVARAERAEALFDQTTKQLGEVNRQLGDAHKQIGEATTSVLELSHQLVEANKQQPSSIFDGLTRMFRAQRGTDVEVLPPRQPNP